MEKLWSRELLKAEKNMSKNFLKTNKSCHAKITKPRVSSMVNIRKTTYKLVSKSATCFPQKEKRNERKERDTHTYNLKAVGQKDYLKKAKKIDS